MKFIEVHVRNKSGVRILLNQAGIVYVWDEGELGCTISTTEAIDISEGYYASLKVIESYDEVKHMLEAGP